jgi:gliding motility-associated-like protein
MKINWLLKTLLAFLSISLISSACGKIKYKNKCCKGELIVETEDYNEQGVSFFAPNAFSPNNDGINDLFQVYCEGINPQNFVFEIRKGCKQVFYSTNPTTQWDGSFRGKIKPGIYKYKIEALTIHDETVSCKGEVCVIEYPNPNKGFKDCDQCVFGDMLNISTGEFQHPTFEEIDCRE